MTIGELRNQLNQFSDDQQVIFTPDDYCGEGYPEFEYADVTGDHDFISGDPVGTVTIRLKGERP